MYIFFSKIINKSQMEMPYLQGEITKDDWRKVANRLQKMK
jgi:hypothetical protein